MDGLLAEISAKRKALSDTPNVGPKKYLRRADIERAKEEEETRKKEEAAASKAESRAEKMRKDVTLPPPTSNLLAEGVRIGRTSQAGLTLPARRLPYSRPKYSRTNRLSRSSGSLQHLS